MLLDSHKILQIHARDVLSAVQKSGQCLRIRASNEYYMYSICTLSHTGSCPSRSFCATAGTCSLGAKAAARQTCVCVGIFWSWCKVSIRNGHTVEASTMTNVRVPLSCCCRQYLTWQTDFQRIQVNVWACILQPLLRE